jgi:hypothetical protein
MRCSQWCLRRNLFSWIWHLVVRWKLTDVSDECRLHSQGWMVSQAGTRHESGSRQRWHLLRNSGWYSTDYILRATGWTTGFDFLQGQEIVFYSTAFRPVLGSTQPMENGGLFPWGWSGMGVKPTTNLILVQRSRMVEIYLHSPYVFAA